MTKNSKEKQGHPGKQTALPAQASSSQHARFVDTARELGCDEDPAAFDEKLKVIARQKPKEEPRSD